MKKQGVLLFLLLAASFLTYRVHAQDLPKLAVNRFFVTDSDGLYVTEPSAGEKLIITAEVYNGGENDAAGIVYAAQYKDGKLTDIASSEALFKAGEEKAVSIEIIYAECDSCMVYIWEKNTQSPISAAYSVPPKPPEPTPGSYGTLPDFYFFKDALDSITFYQNPKSKIHPLWENPQLFNSSYTDADGKLRPALKNTTGTAWVKNGEYTDYAVFAHVEIGSGSENTLMLGIRHTASDFYGESFYAAGIYEGNKLAVLKYPKSVDASAQPEVLASTEFNEPGFKGQLSVSAVDSTITVYIDGSPMLSVCDNDIALTFGGAGVVSAGATAKITDFGAFPLYDESGGHLDNFFRGGYQASTEALSEIMTDSELSEVKTKNYGFEYYTAPEFSLSLDSLKNENIVSAAFARGNLNKNGNYAAAGGGILVYNTRLSAKFTIETELNNAIGTVAEMLNDNDKTVWKISISENMLSCNSQTIDLTGLPENERHLVLSYDGAALAVYVNGRLAGAIDVSLPVKGGTFRFFRGMSGYFGSLNIYSYPLTNAEAELRFGISGESFETQISEPSESVDFTRYVYNLSPVLYNKVPGGASVSLPEGCIMRKDYERTVYDENVYFLNTSFSERKAGAVLGDESEDNSFRNQNELTLAMWVRVDSGRKGQYHRLFSYGNRDRSEFGFEAYVVNSNIQVYAAEFTKSTMSKLERVIDFSEYTDKWCLLVFTRKYDENEQCWENIIYANSKPIYSEKIKSSRTDESKMLLGICTQPNFANPLWGDIGSAEVYTSYMSADDVSSLYRKGITKFRAPKK